MVVFLFDVDHTLVFSKKGFIDAEKEAMNTRIHIEYKNSGVVYVNVETTSLRILKTDINT
jgi:hypothetical protein